MSVKLSVAPVEVVDDKASEVIHREPIPKEVDCTTCPLSRICETGGVKQRPTITAETPLSISEWMSKLSESNCKPSVPEKFW